MLKEILSLAAFVLFVGLIIIIVRLSQLPRDSDEARQHVVWLGIVTVSFLIVGAFAYFQGSDNDPFIPVSLRRALTQIRPHPVNLRNDIELDVLN